MLLHFNIFDGVCQEFFKNSRKNIKKFNSKFQKSTPKVQKMSNLGCFHGVFAFIFHLLSAFIAFTSYLFFAIMSKNIICEQIKIFIIQTKIFKQKQN